MEPNTGPVDPQMWALSDHVIAFVLCVGVVAVIFLALRGRGGAQAPPSAADEEEPEED